MKETPIFSSPCSLPPSGKYSEAAGSSVLPMPGTEHARSSKFFANSVCELKRHLSFVVILSSIVTPLP